MTRKAALVYYLLFVGKSDLYYALAIVKHLPIKMLQIV